MANPRLSMLPADRALVLRTCLVYLTIFAWSGLNQPYLPIWLAARDLTDAQIALVVGLPFFTRILFTPLFGRLADSVEDRRMLTRAMAAAGLVLALALWRSTSFWPILILYVLMMVPLQNVGPIFDASVLDLVRRGVVREFGRMRLWGSAGYAFSSAIGGWILLRGGPDAVFGAFIIALGAMLAASFAQPPAPRTARAEIASDGPEVVRRPVVVLVMVIAALVLASQATWNGFGSIRLRQLGVPDSLIGIYWALATGSEMAMFWAGPLLARRFGPFGVLILAACGAILRWGAMSTDPGPVAMIALQMLHALTFSAAHLGVMRFLAVTVTVQRSGSAQATFVTISSILLGAATVAAGPLYHAFGSGAYLWSAALPVAAILLLLAFRRAIETELENGKGIIAKADTP